jgi:lipopolysaccharide transport system permease protein
MPLKLREIWDYRELLYYLSVRDIRLRYKQTVLGVAWAVIQPVFVMLVFTVFLGKVAKIPSDGVPYAVFCLAALVPWMYFSNSLNASSESLVRGANLITKVYFPRPLLPLAGTLSGLVDFAIAFVVLIGLIFFFGLRPTLAIVWLPAFVVLAVITAVGVGLWLSALNVRYRDVRYTVPFLTQLWLFASPVIYPSSLLPQPWRDLYGLNPMVGVIEGFRWTLLGSRPLPIAAVLLSCFMAMIVAISGAYYFRRTEKTFADVI